VLGDNLAETLQAIKDRGGEIECDMGNATAEEFIYSAEVCERSGGSLVLMWIFIFFMIVSAFCLLNMLIGVLCEVIQDSAETENQKSQITELRQHMSEAFQSIDQSGDGFITSNEWTKMKKEKTVRASMANLGVEEQFMEERLDQMQESLFGIMDADVEDESEEEPDMGAVVPVDNGKHGKCDKQRNGLTFDEFIEKVVEIRPDAPASALDIEILRVRVEREEKTFNARLDFIEQALIDAKVGGSYPDPSKPSKGGKNARAEVIDTRTCSTAVFLKNIPTELLFATLNNRAPADSGPPMMLTNANR